MNRVTEFCRARTRRKIVAIKGAPGFARPVIERAGLERDDVQACLLVGGSTLAPQVREAVRGFFPHARVLTHADADGTQMAVARGAVAYGLARRGQGLKIGGGSARGYFFRSPTGKWRCAIVDWRLLLDHWVGWDEG